MIESRNKKVTIVDALEDWKLNMDAGMTPKVARELTEHEHQLKPDEKIILTLWMYDELEMRYEGVS